MSGLSYKSSAEIKNRNMSLIVIQVDT